MVNVLKLVRVGGSTSASWNGTGPKTMIVIQMVTATGHRAIVGFLFER